MELNVKHFATMAVTLAITVVLFASVLVPILSEAQKDAGDQTIYSNLDKYPSGIFARPIEVGDELVCQPGDIKLNGESVLRADSAFPVYDGVALCDKFGVRTGNATTLVSFLTSGFTQNYGGTITVSCSEPGIVKMDREGASLYEGDYDFCYVACPIDEATTMMSIGAGLGPGTKIYVSDIGQVYMSGMYTSGENDTGYWYFDGELHISQNYTSSIDLNLALVEGTTDVYEIDPIVAIGGESFTPYYCIAPIEVVGHRDSGAVYSLIGIIPLLILTGLVIGVVGSFIRNRD